MYKENKKYNIDRTNDLVRQEYKRYKKRKPPPDFSDVIDLLNPLCFQHLLLPIKLTNVSNNNKYCRVGLKHPNDWFVYEVKSCPGFIVVRNPFLSYGAQSHWVKQSLTTYTKKPFPCNLDILMDLDKDKTMWDISHEKSVDNKFINQLRWTHMGYHFDYNIVDYKAKQYFGFPDDLAELTETIASVFQFPHYIAETGIINYYPEGSSMGGHTDHYEEELSQPLISYSFGQSAVYLIGGDTRDIKPEAVWVRSGDIMLMTGPSRTAFHAVPCIITKPTMTGPGDLGTCPLVLKDKIEDSDHEDSCRHKHVWTNEMKNNWQEFSEYISNTRININIRQVHRHKSF